MFNLNSVGIVTARDNLTIHWSPDEVWTTVLNFSKMDKELARQAYNLGKDAKDWKVELAQKDLIESGLDKRKIIPILYRPFDIRYAYYTGKSRGFICRPRPEVMQHMLAGRNLALVFVRQIKAFPSWHHCFVSKLIIESCLISNSTSEISYIAPLYIYPEKKRGDLYNDPHLLESQANLKPGLLAALEKAYKRSLTPEQIFQYIYAVLYAPTYRERYIGLLRLGFPRIPFAAEWRVFKALTGLGERLVGLHLLC
ncbi:MAG: DNA methyltransferase, partial [Candidatus Aminicenantes bacterium]|nr:DNA methyltransferase [Candidatus Aminicenantes bacterium]